MKVLQIGNLGYYNTRKNSKVSRNSKSRDVQSQNLVSFQGNYKQTYLNALKTPIKNMQDCRAMFKNLRYAVLTEELSIESNHYIKQELKNLLETAKGVNSEIILAKSNDYASPLMTLGGGSVNFHHPDYGKYGNGNISFYLDGNRVTLTKDYYAIDGSGAEHFEFWNSGNIKEYSKSCNGSICETIKYNEDGSRKRSFFDILFGD